MSDELRSTDVLVVGGGISGITAALELNRLNRRVTLVEASPNLGGLAASFCCKASAICNKCAACVVDKRVAELKETDRIDCRLATEIVSARVEGSGYILTLRREGQSEELSTKALVVATGIDPYDATDKAEYGYGRFRNVITARDLDEMLRNRGGLVRPSDGEVPRKAAFFQCVGSRDAAIGRLYCSQVCCAYALRLIRTIRHKYPELEVAFLYMDIQPAGPSFAGLLRSCRADNKIRFIRSLPSKVYHSPDEQLWFRFVESAQEEVREEAFDLLVLSTGMAPADRSVPLAEMLPLARNSEGFLAVPEEANGLFVTGACAGPKDIDRSIVQGDATALAVETYLRRMAQ